MKKLLIILLSVVALTAIAQNEVKRIAILETVDRAGNVNLGVKNLLRQSITFGINRLQGYEGYNRVDMAQITGEHNFQRTGYVSDSDIKKLGSMTGAQYVLIAEATNYDATHILVFANLVDVETGRVTNSSIPKVAGIDPEQMYRDCAEVAKSLLGITTSGSNTSSYGGSSNNSSSYNRTVNQDFTEDISGENVKTILVTPENATIFINDQEVGNGSYSYKFDGKTDFIKLKFTAPGFITKTVKLMKDNPKQTVSYTLYEDESFKFSNNDADIANKWIIHTCKKGITKDKVWHDLMDITAYYFKYFEERDKSAGWIKTAWHVDTFLSGQTVRTRLEVRIMDGGEEGNELSYKIRISSEIKDTDCFGDQCYEKYPRVLRKFYDVINDMQSSLGANN